jgi:hypothetical protein
LTILYKDESPLLIFKESGSGYPISSLYTHRNFTYLVGIQQWALHLARRDRDRKEDELASSGRIV